MREQFIVYLGEPLLTNERAALAKSYLEAWSSPMALKRVTSREAAAADMCREGCFNVEASSTALKKI